MDNYHKAYNVKITGAHSIDLLISLNHGASAHPVHFMVSVIF